MDKKAMVYVGKKVDQAAAIIEQYGGTKLADYGQSVLVLLDDPGLGAFQKAGFRVRELPKRPVMQIAGFELDTTVPMGLSTSAVAAGVSLPSGRSHHIMRLQGPIHPDWKSQLERMGILFHQSLGEDQFLVSIESTKIDNVQALGFIEAVSPYFPAMKVNPALLTRELRSALSGLDALVPLEPETVEEVTEDESSPGIIGLTSAPITPVVDTGKVGNLEVVLFEGENMLSVVNAVSNLGAKVHKSSNRRIILYADMDLVPQIAAIPQVREVNPYRPVGLTNNVATGIIHANTLHNTIGLDGSGQIVAIADTGLDTGVNDATMLDDFQGRIVNIYALGRPGDASDIHNHGTHVAGSVLGDGANSNGTIRGIAPEAKLVFQSTMDANRELGGLPPDLDVGLFDVARDDGAHIHTNSWGANLEGAYTGRSWDVDVFAFNNRNFLILFAAGNFGRDAFGNLLTGINSPGTAKNCLTVGASESNRQLPQSVNFPASPSFPTGAIWQNFDDRADNQNQVTGFSCLGPAQNNRQKPDVVAPGSFILSTRSTVSVADTGPDGLGGTGDEDGVFTHPEAVGIGLPGQPLYGAGDQNAPAAPANSGPNTDNYYYSDGTSMATPLTAGACALLRQYLIEQRGHTPSAALLKALIINGAVDMGMGIPHNGQGWGRLDLTNTLFPSGTRHIYFDDSLENAVLTGDVNSYDVWVSSITEPLVITLVWRDYRGSTIENKLHLRVIHVGSGTESSSENISFIRNNVQKVVIDPPQVGQYRIEVEGISVGTGIPELAGLRQDYALVVANAIGFSCKPVDIVQVIDRSGSMGFSGYMEPAKERAKHMIDILQINDQAGLVSFASSAVEDMTLTAINAQDDKDNAHGLIDTITSGGATDLREALEQGLTTLGPGTGQPRAMVFLSDGKHTVGTPAVDDLFLNSIAAANTNVYTIALGQASDFAVLNNIANRTGTGSVYSVESAADLHKLHEIYYDIIGDIGCGGVTHLASASLEIGKELIQRATISKGARAAFFAASWPQGTAEIEFRLKSPSGRVYKPAAMDAIFYQGSSHAFYRLPFPEDGTWKLEILHLGGGNDATWVTTSAMADTEVDCNLYLEPKYLFDDKILLRLRATHNGHPLINGKAIARITYPTKSVDSLLKEYAPALKEVKLDKEKMAGDLDDEAKIKLGILADRLRARGTDIFERDTVDIELQDDGKLEDTRAGDGEYTAFINPTRMGVAGNFQGQVFFTVENDKLGTFTWTKLAPIYVPDSSVVENELTIKNIIVRKNISWGYSIIGAQVLKANGEPATPQDGVTVSMTLKHGYRREVSGDLPYYRRGRYYIWRFKKRGLNRSQAPLRVMAKVNGVVVDMATKTIDL